MGSEFTNADMSKPSRIDFDYQTVGSEIYNDRSCWKIESKCKTEAIQNENGFSRCVSFIDKANYLCYKVEFYDFEGKLHRVQTIDNYKKQANGKYFAYKMAMENVQTGRKSEMITNRFQAGSQLSESVFAPAALEK
jgi:hypothetical protein